MIGDPLDISAEGDIVVAALRGDIDLSNAKMIANSIGEAVPNDAAGVVLDLGAVTYLDSSGVHLVFDLPEGSRISRVLDLVNVGAVVPIETTVDAALGRVRAPDQ